MKPNESLPNDAAGRFRTTHWSVVLLSAQTQVPGSQTALADLCRLYWYPLYAFVRRRGYNAEDAQDLTQGFFCSLLERKSLRQVAPQRGKFRSFPLASLKNYLSDEFDRMRSIKRGGQIEFVTLDFEEGEERYRADTTDSLTAEKIFDGCWSDREKGGEVRILRALPVKNTLHGGVCPARAAGASAHLHPKTFL